MGWVSINLLVIGGAPQVLVRERRTGRRLVERQPILLVFENLLDGAKAIRAQPLGALAGGFEPIRPVFAAQSHEAQTRAVALFGVWPPFEDAGDEPARGGAGLFGPGDQPRGRPFGVRPMSAWHVRDLRGIAAAAGEAHVRGDRAVLEEDFDGRRRKARLDAFVDQLIRHAVEVVGDLDVIVDVDADSPSIPRVRSARRATA